MDGEELKPWKVEGQKASSICWVLHLPELELWRLCWMDVVETDYLEAVTFANLNENACFRGPNFFPKCLFTQKKKKIEHTFQKFETLSQPLRIQVIFTNCMPQWDEIYDEVHIGGSILTTLSLNAQFLVPYARVITWGGLKCILWTSAKENESHAPLASFFCRDRDIWWQEITEETVSLPNKVEYRLILYPRPTVMQLRTCKSLNKEKKCLKKVEQTEKFSWILNSV